MLRYLKYSRELKIVNNFLGKLQEFYEIEDKVRKEFDKQNSGTFFNHREVQLIIQKKCVVQYKDKYSSLRIYIAQEIPKIRRIAQSKGIQTERYNYPTHGGPTITVGIFDSALEDLGYSPTFQETREDTLNKLIGILKETKKQSLIQMFNPINLLSFILRIPFLIIKETGFNTDKIENELIGKAFKLVFLVSLIYCLLRLGFTQEQIIGLIRFK